MPASLSFESIRYQPKRQFKVWIPDAIPPTTNHPDGCAWILASICKLLSQNNRNDDSWGVARLCGKHLLTILGRQYKKRLNELMTAGVIKSRNGYSSGVCRGYSLTAKAANASTIHYCIKSPAIVDNLNAFFAATHTEAKKSVRSSASEKLIFRSLYTVHLDATEEELAEDRRQTDIRKQQNGQQLRSSFDDRYRLLLDAADRLRAKNEKRYYCRDEFGRVHNAALSLVSESRRRLRHPDGQLVEIDIACCQIKSLEVLLRMHSSGDYRLIPELAQVPVCIPESELAAFAQCTDGDFYQFVGDKLSMTRQAIKQRALAALFGRWGKRGPFSPIPRENELRKAAYQIIRSHFPNITEFLRRIKTLTPEKGAYKRLGQWLQRVESYIVIDLAIPAMIERHKVDFSITLHDAVVCLQQDAASVKLELVSAFQKYNTNIKIKEELYNH